MTQLDHYKKVDEELKNNPELIRDKNWRLYNLYYIQNKRGEKILFKPNKPQADFLKIVDKYYRFLILKSRQLGFSTFITIWILDEILFTKNKNAGIVADTKQFAGEVFNDKVQYALDNMPPSVRLAINVTKNSAKHLKVSWKDDSMSQFKVALSLRGMTPHYVHSTELAKQIVTSPLKATEFITGTLPAIPMDGKLFIESTANGMAGYFYDTFMKGWKKKDKISKELSRATPYPVFYNWQWDDMDMSMIEEPIPIEDMDETPDINWKEYKDEHGLSDVEITYYYIKWESLGRDIHKLQQEYPTCVVGETYVETQDGTVMIKDIKPDGELIKQKFCNGVRDVYDMTTEMGYSVRGTSDHKIKTTDGSFVPLGEMKGKDIILSPGVFGKHLHTISWSPKPFINSQITIDEDMGRFLGYFMGDGSFYGKTGTVSMACTLEDNDVIQDVENLMRKLFGEPRTRIIGDKKGGVEIRTSSKDFIDPMNQMGILRQNSSYSYKRKVHVPEYIKNSPEPVIKNFLSALFEADGFADRSGTRIVFYTKYEQFSKDVQLLLLKFGITCRRKKQTKISGNGSEYVGYEIALRKNESKMFREMIGFVSSRKNERLDSANEKSPRNTKDVLLSDTVSQIDYVGEKEVWDIETNTHEFVANGIVVHNCPEEAFGSSGMTFLSQAKLFKMKQELIEPVRYHVSNEMELVPDASGDLYMYRELDKSKAYVIGGDVAEGLATGDWSVLAIVEAVSKELVGIYHCKEDPYEFAQIANRVGRLFNNALMVIESNKDGLYVNDMLVQMDYPNMYYREEVDAVTKQVNAKMGWKTSSTTRPYALSALKTVFNRGDFWGQGLFIDEALTFVMNERGKAEAMSGSHDDIMMATAIAYGAMENKHFKDSTPSKTGDNSLLAWAFGEITADDLSPEMKKQLGFFDNE